MKILFRILFCLVLLAGPLRADPAVLAAQKKLQEMGYYQGRLDGAAGSQTAAAIRRYQVAKKLMVTGELNPQTLDSLGLPRPAAAR